mgnify:CR=1 FL=1
MKQTLKNKLIGATVGLLGLVAPVTDADAQQTQRDTLCFNQQPTELTENTTPFHYEPVRDNGDPQTVTVTKNGAETTTYDLAQSLKTADSTAESIANTYADVINQRTGGIANIDGNPRQIDSQREQQLRDKLKDDITAHLTYVQNDGDCATPQYSPDDITITTTNTGHIDNIAMDVDNPIKAAKNHESIIYDGQQDEARPSIFLKGGLTADQPANALLPNIHRPDQQPVQVEAPADTVNKYITKTETDTVQIDDTPAMTIGAGYALDHGPSMSVGVDNLGEYSVTLEADYNPASTETQRVTGDVKGPTPTAIEQGGLTLPEGVYFQPVSQSQTTESKLGASLLAGRDITDNLEARLGGGIEATTTETTGKEYVRADPTQEGAASTDALYKNKANPLGGPYQESNTTIEPVANAAINVSLDNGLGATISGEYDIGDGEITPTAQLTYDF